jgi:hypothetical protein
MVPAGSNTIELKFFPYRMPLGISLTFVGITGLLLLGAVLHFLRSKEESSPVPANVKDDYDGYDYEEDEFDFNDK